MFGLHAVPVDHLPMEWHAIPRSMPRVDLTYLRQNPPGVHRIGTNDVLGVYIQGALDGDETTPPFQFPLEDTNVDAPAVGHPVTVAEKGTISLPDIPAIPVSGLTLEQAKSKILNAYVAAKVLNRDAIHHIVVTLIKPRTEKILVFRQDSAAVSSEFLGSQDRALFSKRGSAHLVELPVYENDLLHALVTTGGLPGVDAKDEIWILRRKSIDPARLGELTTELNQSPDPSAMLHRQATHSEVVRIPLRLSPCDTAPFSVEQTILHTGDVVFIESRDAEFFYSGGLLSGAQIPIPRDYDLDVIGAIALAGGNVAGPAGANAAATNFRSGPGNIIPPSRVTIVRMIPGGQVKIRVDLKKALDDPRQRIRIQPGDVVMLQYTPKELAANVALNFVNVNYFINN